MTSFVLQTVKFVNNNIDLSDNFFSMNIAINERLVKIRKDFGYTQVRMAKELDISVATLNRYEKGHREPSVYILNKIAELTGCQTSWLISGATDSLESHEIHSPKGIGRTKKEGFIYVPLYDVEASAGHGTLVHSEQVIDFLAFKEQFITRELGLNPKHILLIKAIGDSMNPTIRAGALLLVNSSVTKVRNDGIYVIRQNSDLLVKRIQNMMDGQLKVRSDNPEYEPLMVASEALDILGEVVWGGQKF